MRAVWSFWSKPYFPERQSSWHSEFHHWLAWGLSLYAARRFYPQTCLVTDDIGARILIDELRLPFESVSTALNTIDNQNPGWWALGKLEAYRRQRTPFVHLDTDVFLWDRLPQHLEDADVFAQNPEPFDDPATASYQPEEFEQAVKSSKQGWLPQEWLWYRRFGGRLRGECCGVFGGRRIDFTSYYADTALRLVANPRNRQSLKALPGKAGHMLLVEQFLLSACVEYHRRHRRSPYRGIEIRYIFPTVEEAFQPKQAANMGFTHLAGGVKRNAIVARNLERRVQDDLPDYYERCLSYFLCCQKGSG